MSVRAGLILVAMTMAVACVTKAPPASPGAPGEPALAPDPADPGLAPALSIPGEDLSAVIRPGLALAPSQFPFEDPTTPEERLTGRYFMGRWIATADGVQQEEAPPSPSISLRRYTGAAFGEPGGKAPPRYRVEAELQAYQPAGLGPEDVPGSPVGALALVPYYKDTTHYVLMVATPTQAQVWMVDGMRPGDEWDASKYRRYLMQLPTPIAVGDTVKWGARVDTARQHLEIYLNGELKESFADPFIQEGDHGIALFSNGNYVRYGALTLKALP